MTAIPGAVATYLDEGCGIAVAEAEGRGNPAAVAARKSAAGEDSRSPGEKGMAGSTAAGEVVEADSSLAAAAGGRSLGEEAGHSHHGHARIERQDIQTCQGK